MTTAPPRKPRPSDAKLAWPANWLPAPTTHGLGLGLGLAMALLLGGCKPETSTPLPPVPPPAPPTTSTPAPSPVASATAAAPAPAPEPAASTAVLRQMTAPIALYPDKLVAQVLAATQFPDQVTAAERWLGQNPGLTGRPLVQAVSAQPWDPSVKSLTEFPNVLSQLASNLPWTRALGSAYAQSPADVLAAIQSLRQVATQSGQLKSGEQINVRSEPAQATSGQPEPAVIVIEPTQPRTVYVPQYDPRELFREALPADAGLAPVPTSPHLGDAIAFGSGVVVGRWLIDDWGWQPWDMRWHGHWHRPGSYFGGQHDHDRPHPPPHPPEGGQRPPAPAPLPIRPPAPAPAPLPTAPGASLQMPPPAGTRPVQVKPPAPVHASDRPMYRLPGEEPPSPPPTQTPGGEPPRPEHAVKPGMPIGQQPASPIGVAPGGGHAPTPPGVTGNPGDRGAVFRPNPPQAQPQPMPPGTGPAAPAPSVDTPQPVSRGDAGQWRMAPPQGAQPTHNGQPSRPSFTPHAEQAPGRFEPSRPDAGRISTRQPDFGQPVPQAPKAPAQINRQPMQAPREATSPRPLQTAPREAGTMTKPARMGPGGRDDFQR